MSEYQTLKQFCDWVDATYTGVVMDFRLSAYMELNEELGEIEVVRRKLEAKIKEAYDKADEAEGLIRKQRLVKEWRYLVDIKNRYFLSPEERLNGLQRVLEGLKI